MGRKRALAAGAEPLPGFSRGRPVSLRVHIAAARLGIEVPSGSMTPVAALVVIAAYEVFAQGLRELRATDRLGVAFHSRRCPPENLFKRGRPRAPAQGRHVRGPSRLAVGIVAKNPVCARITEQTCQCKI